MGQWMGGIAPVEDLAGEAGLASQGRRRSRGREGESAAGGWEASGRGARESWGEEIQFGRRA